MICPECGAGNRDGASYCDSCGEPLSEAVRTLSEGVRASANRSAGFVGLMTLDWTARSALAGIAGILGPWWPPPKERGGLLRCSS